MVEEVGKMGAISNQKFDQKGMKLSQLKENKQVYEFFKKAGLSDANYVYASDVQNVFAKFDENQNGKLSVNEARAMGLEGSRKEIKNAVKLLNEILETELNEADEVYPTKVDENTTQYFDKNGTIKYQAQKLVADDETIEKYTFYRDGDTSKVQTYAEKSEGYGVVVKFNDANLPESETINMNGTVQTTSYEYDETNQNLKSQTVESKGTKTVIDFDAKKRPINIVETNVAANIESVTQNQYDDENGTMTQILKNNPELLKDGIVETQSTYNIDEESGKTDELIYRKEIGVDGKVKEFSQIAPDEIEEKRDGYIIRTKWHEDGKTSTVQDGNETHVIEYDKEGNTFVYVKNGENFSQTAKRLLGENASEEQVNAFRELNKDLIKSYGKNKVEAFNVGEKIRVPMELEYNEANKENLTVDPKAELKKFKNTPNNSATATGGVKPEGTKPEGTKADGTKPTEPTKPTEATKVETLNVNKKQLDESGIQYKIKGNNLSYVDKKGRTVVMTYQNGLKTKETAYPPKSQNVDGKQLTARRYYDKEYKNGVLVREREYFDSNPNKLSVQKDYEDGELLREVKCFSDAEKSRIIGEMKQDGQEVDSVKVMHSALPKERTDYVKGQKVRTIHFGGTSPKDIQYLETYKNGYTTTTVYENGDTTKVSSIATTYPDSANVVRKDYQAGNLDIVKNLYEMNSNMDLKPQYNNKGTVIGYVKQDGSEWDSQGNLKKCPLAEDLYKQLKGYSDNGETKKMLDKIDKNNIVDVLEYFNKLSPNEQLFEYVNNEWGDGLGRKVMDPILKELLDLGSSYGIKNAKLTNLLSNNKNNARSNYNTYEINDLNANIPKVLAAIRNNYKTLIKENM